jgi:hypothetical protein
MIATTPCYRHSRTTWIASCSDCTAWHLAAALAGRGAPARGAADFAALTPSRPLTNPRPPAVRLAA